jgi:hypothetical protein
VGIFLSCIAYQSSLELTEHAAQWMTEAVSPGSRATQPEANQESSSIADVKNSALSVMCNTMFYKIY